MGLFDRKQSKKIDIINRKVKKWACSTGNNKKIDIFNRKVKKSACSIGNNKKKSTSLIGK